MKYLFLIVLLGLTACGEGSVDPRLAKDVDAALEALDKSCGYIARTDINYKIKDLPGSTMGFYTYDMEDKIKSEVNILIDGQAYEMHKSEFGDYTVQWVLIHELAHSSGLGHRLLGTGPGADLMSSRTSYGAIQHISPASNPAFLKELCLQMRNNRLGFDQMSSFSHSNQTHKH